MDNRTIGRSVLCLPQLLASMNEHQTGGTLDLQSSQSSLVAVFAFAVWRPLMEVRAGPPCHYFYVTDPCKGHITSVHTGIVHTLILNTHFIWEPTRSRTSVWGRGRTACHCQWLWRRWAVSDDGSMTCGLPVRHRLTPASITRLDWCNGLRQVYWPSRRPIRYTSPIENL